jgi:hypothetical protein
LREFAAFEPSLPSFARLGEDDFHDFAMQSLLVMMIDCRRKVLQIAPRAAAGALVRLALTLAPRRIFPAERPGDFIKPPAAKELQQALCALASFFRSRQSRRNVDKIDCNDVCYFDFR